MMSTAGVISGTPTSNAGSPFTVAVTVNDGRGGTAVASFQLTVNAAAAVTPPTPAPPTAPPSGGGDGGGGSVGLAELLAMLAIGALAIRRRPSQQRASSRRWGD
jgi:putative Ig domain-containing protein